MNRRIKDKLFSRIQIAFLKIPKVYKTLTNSSSFKIPFSLFNKAWVQGFQN